MAFLGLAARAALPALLFAQALPAVAALGSPVTVTLSAPGGVIGNTAPITATDTVSPATGITVGDGTQIGSGWMLPNEFIHFSGNSILVDIAAGNVNGAGQLVTGYLGLGSNHAQYRLSNLAVAGSIIVGFSGTLSGLTSPTALSSFVTLATPSSLTINLDNLVLTPVPGGGQSDALAHLTINLTLQPVPEPASWALMLAGGLGICGFRQARTRAGLKT